MYYYNFYLLMITMLKHVFGTDLFQSNKIYLKNLRYIYIQLIKMNYLSINI